MLTRLYKRARLQAGFFMLLLGNGCTSLPMLPETLPDKIELTQTPFFPQEDHQCGPAALATVLNYQGLQVTPDELTTQVFLPRRKGSLQTEIVAASRHYGMLAYPLTPDFSALLTEVAAGNPVLVLQNLAFDWLPQWHYAVVIGYDLADQEVFLRSGRHRRWQSKFSAFNNTWQRSNNWALVIVPSNQIPHTAKVLPFLKAALDLELTGRQEQALIAYRAATVRWPDDQRTWLALGNSAFAFNRLQEAQNALKWAISLEPGNAIALNNLAYVYLRAGCNKLANQTIQRALRSHPNDKNLQDSVLEIKLKSSKITAKACQLTP